MANEQKVDLAYTAIVSAIGKKLKKKVRFKRISKELENNPTFGINTVDPSTKRTILHHACRKGLDDIIQFLLDIDNIDIDIQSKTGETPLMEAIVGYNEVHDKKKSKHAACIELLLQNKCNTEFKSTANGWTALHEAAFNNYTNAIQLLLKHGANINSVTNENETALMLSILQKHIETARVLLSNDLIDVNLPTYRTDLGWITPISMAARFASSSHNNPAIDADADSRHNFNAIFDMLLQRNACIHCPPSIIERHSIKSNAPKTCYSAIEHARQKGRWEIASKLLLHSLGEKLGEQVMSTKFDVSKDMAMARNMIEIYDQQFSDKDNYLKFKQNIIQSVISALDNYKPFSKDLLLIAWKFNFDEQGTNIMQGLNLWQTLQQSCIDLLSPPTRKFDFWFFRDNILNSSLWFQQYGANRYLYQELIDIIDKISQKEQSILKVSLLQTIDDEKNEYWTKLKQFEYRMPNVIINAAAEQKEKINIDSLLRQDGNFSFKEWHNNGLQATHSASYLDDKSLDLRFNITRYYDNKIYLPRLRFVAFIINNQFQSTIKQLMAKSKISGYALQGGPLKTMERCLIKTETDYAQCTFPKTARVLDVARCSITFERCKDLYDGLLFIVTQIEAQKTGFKLVARIKNTFCDIDVNQPQYGDIKINAVFEHDSLCMIVELQLLLSCLLKFKKRNHNLYAVQRKEEFFKNVIHLNALIQPEHSFFTAAAVGDIKTIYHAIKYFDIDVNLTDDRQETPLFHAVRNNKLKAVRLLVEYGANVNDLNSSGWGCLYSAAAKGNIVIIKYLLFECKANPNPSEEKCPVTIAAFSGHFECVKCLVENGSFIEQKALSLSRRHYDIFQYLEEQFQNQK